MDVKNEESDEKCSKVFDYAGHMFSIVCRMVLSDIESDVAYRRVNPAAKSYPGYKYRGKFPVKCQLPL